MSKANFDAKLKEIEAIADSEVKIPGTPIGEYVQEAENLAEWAKMDKAKLEKAGLDWALLEDVPIRAGACRYAQSIWARDRQSIEEAQKEWKEKSPAAFDLRDELVHHFTFAFRKDPSLISKVQKIREGSSNADMLQDLSDLHILGTEQMGLLKAIGYDTKQLQVAANTSDELSVVLARSNGKKSEDDAPKQTRDKAYTFLKQAVDEIREVGQYLFYRDNDRKKGYVSTYRKRRRYNKGNDETPEAPEA
ncbi:MAG: hypothetical protein HC819_22775 [Cyclobacteriaceae bacterium]|nr:hypothetical protein [Cyclobacteriaceae bacterium]